MAKMGYFNSVLSNVGAPIVATVTVYLAGTATKATIYSDPGGTIKDNPFSTDVLGRFQFFASVGQYDVEISGSGITTYKIQYINISDITKSTQLTDMPQSLTGQARKRLKVMNDETGWECQSKEMVDIRDYGASVDAEDNWAAIQAAIDSVPAIPGMGFIVYTPPGRYKYATTLNLHGYMILRGCGSGSMLDYTGTGIAMAQNSTSAKELRLEDFALVNSGSGTIGIDMDGMFQSLINRLYVEGFSASGIDMTGTNHLCLNNDVIMNEIYYCGKGINATPGSQISNNNTVSKNVIRYTNIGIKTINVEGWFIYKNDIQNFMGANKIGIDYHGEGSTLLSNWMECPDDDFTCLKLNNGSVHNALICNTYHISGSGITLSYTNDGSNIVIEPFLNIFHGVGNTNLPGYLRVGANSGGSSEIGDIVSRRSAAVGAYYFGDSPTNYLYFNGQSYSFGAGALELTGMTTAQRDALTPGNGMIIYNSTLNKFQGYENGVWVSLI